LDGSISPAPAPLEATISPTPAPSSLTLFGTALFGLGALISLFGHRRLEQNRPLAA
jgi:hypothetical protein